MTTSDPDTPFGGRLRAALDTRGPLCVGIDPHAELLDAWGLDDDPDGLARFCDTTVAAVAGQAAVVKPQSAFFERHGSKGIAVLERTIAAARAAGALVLLDVKRGDIGSTMDAYAQAYLESSSPLCVDAVTASPYLGFGSLSPLVETAARTNRGVFVLAYTSNPEGLLVQQARTADGSQCSVAGTIIAGATARNDGAEPLGSLGLVVAANLDPAIVAEHDLAAVNGPLLAPGLGAQGATATQLRALFGAAAHNVLPSSSRDLLRRGPDPSALRAAAERTRDACAAALTVAAA
jgi:orotidine 5'-phosphate decarboxylase subfamily 2